jgi:phosphate uptake regulator
LGNLREVAQALGRRDLSALGRVVERNAKQSRLRTEIENQVVEEMAQSTVSARDRRKLVLVSQVALMFERMGAQTIEISQLCGQVIREPKPSRVTELKKLIEHAVYITDRAATGLVEEDLEMATIAVEQKRSATELNSRINRDLASMVPKGIGPHHHQLEAARSHSLFPNRKVNPLFPRTARPCVVGASPAQRRGAVAMGSTARR